MRAVCLMTVLLLSACSPLVPHPMPGKWITVEITEDIYPRQAEAVVTDKVCIIRIHPDHYTHSCLGHELRHCIEGWWHGEDIVHC